MKKAVINFLVLVFPFFVFSQVNPDNLARSWVTFMLKKEAQPFLFQTPEAERISEVMMQVFEKYGVVPEFSFSGISNPEDIKTLMRMKDLMLSSLKSPYAWKEIESIISDAERYKPSPVQKASPSPVYNSRRKNISTAIYIEEEGKSEPLYIEPKN